MILLHKRTRPTRFLLITKPCRHIMCITSRHVLWCRDELSILYRWTTTKISVQNSPCRSFSDTLLRYAGRPSLICDYNTPMNTAFLSDDRFLLHNTGRSHPERAARLSAVLDRLENQQWFGQLLSIRAVPCDETWLCNVHDLELVRRAKQACLSGLEYLDSPDVQVSKQ